MLYTDDARVFSVDCRPIRALVTGKL